MFFCDILLFYDIILYLLCKSNGIKEIQYNTICVYIFRYRLVTSSIGSSETFTDFTFKGYL